MVDFRLGIDARLIVMRYVLLALALIGCAPDADYPFHVVVDSKYPELLEPTEEALNAWGDALPIHDFLEGIEIGKDPHRCDTVFVTIGKLPAPIAGWHEFSASFRRGERSIQVAPNQNDTADILIHEFGHDLGVEHSDDVRSIMFPIVGVDQKIMPEDVAQAEHTLAGVR